LVSDEIEFEIKTDIRRWRFVVRFVTRGAVYIFAERPRRFSQPTMDSTSEAISIVAKFEKVSDTA
jgi:hypothetical protein